MAYLIALWREKTSVKPGLPPFFVISSSYLNNTTRPDVTYLLEDITPYSTSFNLPGVIYQFQHFVNQLSVFLPICWMRFWIQKEIVANDPSTVAQCCFTVAPLSYTSAQHQNNMRSTSLACWCFTPYLHNSRLTVGDWCWCHSSIRQVRGRLFYTLNWFLF